MHISEVPQANKVVYTLNETAALLGVSRPTINRLIRAEKLRVARIGHRTVRVTDEAIRGFLRSVEETGGVPRSGRPGRQVNTRRKRKRSAASQRRVR